MSRLICGFYSLIGWFGRFVPQLLLRVLVAWHFWDSGLAKFHGQIQSVPEQNTLPFALAGDASFQVIMWVELACAVMILIGFSTRIAALVLAALLAGTFMSYQNVDYSSIVTLWHTIDAQIPAFKFNLALLFILVTLFFIGAGGLSADGIFKLTSCKSKKRRLTEKNDKAVEQEKIKTREAERAAKNAEKKLKQAEVDAKKASSEAKNVRKRAKDNAVARAETQAKQAEIESRKASSRAEDAKKYAKDTEAKSKELEEKLNKVEDKIDKAESDSK